MYVLYINVVLLVTSMLKDQTELPAPSTSKRNSYISH